MLTSGQEKWINHLSTTDKIKITPYNPKTKEIFEKIKKEIREVLGAVEISHRGATSLGISGQGEIDCYIPVAENEFNRYLETMLAYFGKARSVYPLRRAAFVKYIEEIKIEIFLINKKSNDWINGLKFENYLKTHKESLEKYKKLKENSGGLSAQDYYRRKMEFINDILSKTKLKHTSH